MYNELQHYLEILRLDYHLRITENCLKFDCHLHTNMSSHMYTVHCPMGSQSRGQHCVNTRMSRFLEDSVYSSSLRDQGRYDRQVVKRKNQFDAYSSPLYYTPNPLSTPQKTEMRKETTIESMDCSAGWTKDSVTKKEIRPIIDEEYMLFTCGDEKVKEDYVFAAIEPCTPRETKKENESILQRLRRTIISSPSLNFAPSHISIPLTCMTLSIYTFE